MHCSYAEPSLPSTVYFSDRAPFPTSFVSFSSPSGQLMLMVCKQNNSSTILYHSIILYYFVMFCFFPKTDLPRTCRKNTNVERKAGRHVCPKLPPPLSQMLTLVPDFSSLSSVGSGSFSSISQVNVWPGRNPRNHSFHGNRSFGSTSFSLSSFEAAIWNMSAGDCCVIMTHEKYSQEW